MEPTYGDGARLLALRLPARFLRAGMPVVVEVAPDRFIVKRVQQVLDSKHVRLCSDNTATWSRYCDRPMEKSQIRGAVFWPLRREPLNPQPSASQR